MTDRHDLVAPGESAPIVTENQFINPSASGFLRALEPLVKRALPTMINPKTFVQAMMTQVGRNPKLLAALNSDAGVSSMIAALMHASQLGLSLEPSMGHAYLVPYGSKVECIIGYKGLVDLMCRSGAVTHVDARIVYEGDEFVWHYGTAPRLEHRPTLTGRGESVAFYAVAHLRGGGAQFTVMTLDDIAPIAKEAIRKAGGRPTPWKTNEDQMCVKTAVRRLAKMVRISTEDRTGELLARAVELDGAVATGVRHVEGMKDPIVEFEHGAIDVTPESANATADDIRKAMSNASNDGIVNGVNSLCGTDWDLKTCRERGPDALVNLGVAIDSVFDAFSD